MTIEIDNEFEQLTLVEQMKFAKLGFYQVKITELLTHEMFTLPEQAPDESPRQPPQQQ